jgi:translation initiation factor 2B subunit (eIF-2B alpha/beta/delta family)
VTGILARAKVVHNRDFEVLVLKQDLVKTKPLINALRKAGIAYTVVPEYTLEHHIEKATKLFLGAVSIADDRVAVCAAGTANIVSLCHMNHLPVCLFVSSLKISHQPASNQRIHKKEETRSQNNFTYCITTHSHSLVSLEMIDHFVTELGEMGKSAYSEYLL